MSVVSEAVLENAPNNSIRTAWIKAAIGWGIFLVSVLASMWPTAEGLFLTWWDKPEFNHCLLILPIIIYLVYERRDAFSHVYPRVCLWGIIPMILSVGVWLVGTLAEVNLVQQVGLVALIQSSVLALFGIKVVVAFLFPLFYMVFLVPFGDSLIPFLQDFTTDFIIVFLNILDIPVFVDGVFLSIPRGNFHVAEACAGLRFLIATIALGLLMANIAYQSPKRRAIVILLSVIVPIIANGFRATGIVLIGHYSNMKYAVGADHLVFGWFFFAIVIILFVSLAMTFMDRAADAEYTDFKKSFWQNQQGSSQPVQMITIMLMVAVPLSAKAYNSHIESRYETNVAVAFPELDYLSPSATPETWHPHYGYADQEFFGVYEEPGKTGIDFYMAYYAFQNGQKEMIKHGHNMRGELNWGLASARNNHWAFEGRDFIVREELLHSLHQNRLVVYWYYIGDVMTTSAYKAKLYDAWNKLSGQNIDVSVMAVSKTVEFGQTEEARSDLKDFAKALLLQGNPAR